MKALTTLLLFITLCFSASSQAQIGGKDMRGWDALKMGLYPPDIIMRHQQELGITGNQRKGMAGAVKQFQSEVAELQWDLQSEQQNLEQLLDQYEIDTDEALQQVDKVLALEDQFKRAHFRLLIAIKNELTEKQIDAINKRLSEKRAEAQKTR